jgi:hypothetical protein
VSVHFRLSFSLFQYCFFETEQKKHERFFFSNKISPSSTHATPFCNIISFNKTTSLPSSLLSSYGLFYSGSITVFIVDGLEWLERGRDENKTKKRFSHKKLSIYMEVKFVLVHYDFPFFSFATTFENWSIDFRSSLEFKLEFFFERDFVKYDVSDLSRFFQFGVSLNECRI